MPLPALLLMIATLLPLGSFALLVFLGKRLGTPLAGWVATVAIAGSFACSIVGLTLWLQTGDYNDATLAKSITWGAGKNPINLSVPWIPTGNGIQQDHPGFLDVGIYIDSLTIAMFSMITLVASVVHVFSIGYMRDDPRFARYFTYLGLFCFSMLGLVLSSTLLQIFVFWELVGLCSYLLIGFWYEKKSASNAAIKAFVTNRIGDFGFLIGFGILFYHLGNATLPHLWVLLGNAGSGDAIALPGGVMFGAGLLTFTGIALFCGAIGKSAQFPLHVWLPDAMEGPTPVSALIHAATMVAAGVYLVGRIFPILTPDAKLFVAIIGCTTLTMAALIAMVQSDIKKVLAYSTLSQLGYMILAMGIGSWVGGLFHLITHAFFKALLFLGAGSVIHAAHHEQELSQFGGLLKKIPITAITFGIAVLALSGTPLMSGYWSKDLILGNAGAFAVLANLQHKSSLYWLLFLLPVIVAYVTPFYMTRCWMLTFWGRPRNQEVYDHARETPIMFVPLMGLAVLAVISGRYMGVQELLKYAVAETQTYCKEISDTKSFDGFDSAWPATLPEHSDVEMDQGANPAAAREDARDIAAGDVAIVTDPLLHGADLMHRWVFFAFAVGISLAVALYSGGYRIVNVFMMIPPVRWIHTWLYRRMFFDELYESVFIAITIGLSRFIAWFDRIVIDGIVNGVGWIVRQMAIGVGNHDKYVIDGAVNGVGRLTYNLGAAVRTPESGRLRVYVTILILAVAIGLAGAVIVALS